MGEIPTKVSDYWHIYRPLEDVLPKVAVIENVTDGFVNVRPLFCFREIDAFYEWVEKGGHLDHVLDFNTDGIIFYTIH